MTMIYKHIFLMSFTSIMLAMSSCTNDENFSLESSDGLNKDSLEMWNPWYPDDEKEDKIVLDLNSATL